MTLQPRKRIEIVSEASLKPALCRLIEQSGATGYTVIPDVTGLGRHGRREVDELSGALNNVLIVVVAEDVVARRILDGCRRYLEHYAALVSVGDVEVLEADDGEAEEDGL